MVQVEGRNYAFYDVVVDETFMVLADHVMTGTLYSVGRGGESLFSEDYCRFQCTVGHKIHAFEELFIKMFSKILAADYGRRNSCYIKKFLRQQNIFWPNHLCISRYRYQHFSLFNINILCYFHC